MCLENDNQDGVLIVEAGDALIINQNDSPLREGRFLRRLVRQYKKTFLLSLCSIDARYAQFRRVGRQLSVGPAEMKGGAIQAVGDRCSYLGVKCFCCFSSQRVYVRADSRWTNSYRITFADMKKYWNSSAQLLEPFVTVDLRRLLGHKETSQPPNQYEQGNGFDGRRRLE
jgi:hypothetical protein